ncbi:uncharacterized protein K489DRAFT_427324 [Dissoconium aciculare CBS 342.82]|uniref:Uncharacterized protein n=1 Tax=Dissoconium aciculare CBS 342.82 TaxID=1314786 RepID=A0A6J3MIX5_9PEZI|nr:uncharacterized protein K489DRAFT_427324 [Dissoconium aciculare CBS 342.82]KAF1826867.1 hypothetical protein K489DRAFT_427324 [Dissoconium aciculare CBS 342.82]
MALHQEELINLTATEALAISEDEVVRLLERNVSPHGGFVLSGISGIESMSKESRDALAKKFRSAATRIPFASMYSMDSAKLHSRLVQIADAQVNNHSTYQCKQVLLDSPETTPPPELPYTRSEEECRRTLYRRGGRPMRSLHRRSCLVPFAEASSMSMQLNRWTDFRQAQWDHRGSREESIAVFREREKEKWEQHGYLEMTRDASFEHNILKEWRPASTRHRCLSRWSEEVQRSSEMWDLGREVELQEDPRQQSSSADWREYLAYEQDHLEKLCNDVAGSAQRLQVQMKLLQDQLHSRTTQSSQNDSVRLIYETAEELIRRATQNMSAQQDWSRQLCLVECIVQEARQDLIPPRVEYSSAHSHPTARTDNTLAPTKLPRKRRRDDHVGAQSCAPPGKKTRVRAQPSSLGLRRSCRLKEKRNVSSKQ